MYNLLFVVCYFNHYIHKEGPMYTVILCVLCASIVPFVVTFFYHHA